MDDPCASLEIAADRLDFAIQRARAENRPGEELRLQALQITVRDAIRNYRAMESAAAFRSAFTKNFLSMS